MSDPTFVVGADLVEFDRDLPIYQTAQAHWDCVDQAQYGAPLDCLFGEADALHIDGTIHEPMDIAAVGQDPLVALAALSDGLALEHATGPVVFDPSETALVTHTGTEVPIVAHLHDGWSWDISGADWTFDLSV